MARRASWLLGAGAAVLVLIAAVSIGLWPGGGDSLAALPRAAEALSAAPGKVWREPGRRIQEFTIEDPALGRVAAVLSLPDPLPARPLPLVVVLGGLGTGMKAIRHLPPAGDNAVLGYDWPLPRKLPRGLALLRQAPDLHRRVFTIPGQIAAAVAWSAAQPWADPGRISLLGFSLGALAVPAAQHLLQARGLAVGWTVLAYGGADLGALVAAHPRAGPAWARPLLGWIAGRILRPLDPAQHLPQLSGRFLLIGGAEDGLIPAPSARRLRDLAPEPKTEVVLAGAHMGIGAGQEALLDRIVEVTEEWLVRGGALNRR